MVVAVVVVVVMCGAVVVVVVALISGVASTHSPAKRFGVVDCVSRYVSCKPHIREWEVCT